MSSILMVPCLKTLCTKTPYWHVWLSPYVEGCDVLAHQAGCPYVEGGGEPARLVVLTLKAMAYRPPLDHSLMLTNFISRRKHCSIVLCFHKCSSSPKFKNFHAMIRTVCWVILSNFLLQVNPDYGRI